METTVHQLRVLDEAGTSVRACRSCGPVAVPVTKFLALMKDPATRSTNIPVPERESWSYNMGDIIIGPWKRARGTGIDSTGEYQEPVRVSDRQHRSDPTTGGYILRIIGGTMKFLSRKRAFRTGIDGLFSGNGVVMVTDIQSDTQLVSVTWKRTV